MPRPTPPEFLVLGAVSSAQFGSAFAAKTFALTGAGGTALLRGVFAALVLLALTRPTLRGRTRTDWRLVGVYGVVLGAMNWSFYEALDRLPLGVAVTIEFVGPLSVAVAGSRRPRDVLWVLLAGGGVVLLALRGGTSGVHAAGVLLALLAAALWASYIVLAKRVGRSFGSMEGLGLAYAVAIVVVIPIGLHDGGTALLEPRALGACLGVALMSSVIPYSLEITALRTLSTAVFGLLMSLEPAVAATAGVLVLGQPLTAVLAVAVVMVVAASAGATLGARNTVAVTD